MGHWLSRVRPRARSTLNHCVIPQPHSYSPLLFAAEGGNIRIVELLVANGADLQAIDSVRASDAARDEPPSRLRALEHKRVCAHCV